MELRLFIIFRKRIAHRIYPDPANLVCLLLRFFHDLLSSQWVVLHFMSLLCRLSWPTWFQTGCTWGPTRSCQLSLQIFLLFWRLSSSWSFLLSLLMRFIILWDLPYGEGWSCFSLLFSPGCLSEDWTRFFDWWLSRSLCLLSLSRGLKIIPKAIFNNQGNDEYGMRKGRLSGSGYLPLEIRLCPMGYGNDGASRNRDHRNKHWKILSALMNFISHRFVQAILKLHYKTLFIQPEYYQSAQSCIQLYLFITSTYANHKKIITTWHALRTV